MFIELVTGVGVLCLLDWLQALGCCAYYLTGYRCWDVVSTGLVTDVEVLCLLLDGVQVLGCCVYYLTGYRCWGVVLTGLVTGVEASCLLFDWVQVLDWLYEVGACVYWTGSKYWCGHFYKRLTGVVERCVY